MSGALFDCLSSNFGPNIAESSLKWAERPNHHILTVKDKNYPKLLRQIHKKPSILFIKGNTDLLNECQIAMVGCRKASRYGEKTAFELARNLAKMGIIITSGLAIGIDTASHQGALKAGQTIAILGSGLERIYPSSNRNLAEKIAETGALVSEFPLDTRADKLSFPKRNRLISGMSIATLVIEAAVKSGSLITAKFALQQNKEVFAVPGSIYSPQSKGCHQLIREGAVLLESIDDILLELKPKFDEKIKVAVKDLQLAKEHDNSKKIVGERAAILQYLGSDTLSVDCFVEQTGLTIEQVSSMLLIMELDGLIAQVPGGYIRKK